jgi:hypothetical protein
VVGVPTATNIRFLIRLLSYLGNFGISGDWLEEAVDVDRAEGAGEG